MQLNRGATKIDFEVRKNCIPIALDEEQYDTLILLRGEKWSVYEVDWGGGAHGAVITILIDNPLHATEDVIENAMIEILEALAQ